VREEKRRGGTSSSEASEDDSGLPAGFQRLRQVRSEIPAVTHVDGSARVQTVDHRRNPRFYRLLQAFEEQTGCPVLINTSFNVRGEPIVATPEDAYRCFMATDMDVLVLGGYVLRKEEQPAAAAVDRRQHLSQFALD
ncbi:MAG: carbamoyltransferase C-terminal domain-containing protein, partial [Acidobacteriota bacterium]|nr:carbamoyltransferase C-terminal domain-containing protein [Acidobacteriota bacterium]